jgi:hypothetical protein
MQTVLTRNGAFTPSVGEHSLTAREAGGGLREQAAPLFLDHEFPQRLAALRERTPLHPAYEAAVRRCTQFCLEFELLHPEGSAHAADTVSRAVRDILRFPAYALPEITEAELCLLGKFWAFVFHVDDEFDEQVTVQISDAVTAVEAFASASTAAQLLPSSFRGNAEENRLAGLGALSREFERSAREQNDEFARILGGEAPRFDSKASRAVLSIRKELHAVLHQRHGTDHERTVQLARAFADSVYRLFDARTCEIRQRVNRQRQPEELEYNSLRLYTIAMEPLLEASYLFLDGASLDAVQRLRKGVAFQQLLDAVRLQIAYVNDLVSIAKELREPNFENLALLRIVNQAGRETLENLVTGYHRASDLAELAAFREQLNGAVNLHLEASIRESSGWCNALLLQCLHWSGLLDSDNPAAGTVARTAIAWIRAHYLYAFEIARYSETVPLVLGVLSGDRSVRWDIANDPKPARELSGRAA